MYKKWHDARIRVKQFKVGDQVLMFNSRPRLFLEKLKSIWSGPFIVTHSYPHKAMELYNTKGDIFKVNEQRLKLYHRGTYKDFLQVSYLRESTG